MNAREKRMMVILSVLLAVALVFGGYLLVYSPWSQKKEQAKRLNDEIEKKNEKVLAYSASVKRAERYKSMSLPAERTTAQREYDLLLRKIANQSGISSPLVTPKTVQGTSSTPTLPSADGGVVAPGKEKFAYQKIVSDIKLSKVDLRMLGEFLRAYHALPFLQHISAMKITRKDEPGTAASRRTRDRSDPEQWKDLEVTITTEALILDGAEDRKSLVPLPKSLPGIAGSTMYYSLMSSPDFGMKLALAYAGAKPPIPEMSTSTSRDYAMLVGKDIFHGPIPKEEQVVRNDPPPPAPKEDISRFIKLAELTNRSDGSAKFEIRDQANNYLYIGELTPKGEKTTVEISKTWFGPSGKPIADYKFKKDLVITDDGKTASNFTFKVVAVDWLGEGLILSGPPLDKPSVAASGRPAVGGNGFGNRNRGFGGGGGGFAPKLPTPQPNAALAGSWIAALSGTNEVLYFLRNGGSIKDMKVLQPGEVLEIVRRNSANGLNSYLNAEVALPVSEPVQELVSEK
jgi:hypothetical protein